jgi:RimJ/RimL family protein N-acetyltransferase
MIKIEKLPENRWQEYRDLRLEALKNEPLAFTRSYEEEQEMPEKHWREGIKNIVFVLGDSKPIGMAGIFRSSYRNISHIYEMFGVYIRQEYRGQGAGQKLIEATIKEIEKLENAKVIEVGVSTTQKAARHIYEKFGFKVVGHFKRYMYINSKFYEALLMEKYL